MSLWKIAYRSIQQRALASFLTGLSMALGVSLVVAMLVMSGVVGKSFSSGDGLGYNMIVGAKGGSLQLTLNTVYHLSRPVENIPYWYYQEFLPGSQRRDGKDGKFAKYVETAVPCLMGDYYGQARVVGTNAAMFDKLMPGHDSKYEFSAGRNFRDDEMFGAVVGAAVKKPDGSPVQLGDKIHPEHGAPGGHKHDPFEVVGILAQTGKPNDKAVFINMEGFYLMEGHALEAPREESLPREARRSRLSTIHLAAFHPGSGPHSHGPQKLAEDKREVTSVLILLAEPAPGQPRELYAPGLVKKINKDNVAQAVLPIGEITKLFETLVGPIQNILLAVAVLIVIVSGIGIMVSIYNSMSERRHEIAVMRALGAGRGTVMLIVLLESILLAMAGGFFGWLLGHVLLGVMSPWIASRTEITVGFLNFAPQYELILIPGLILLASLVGYLPALSAYRTDVAKALSAAP